MGLARRGWRPTSTQHTATNGGAARIVAVPSDGQGRAQQGVIIKSVPANTAVVWIGFDSTVTNTTGFPLSPGNVLTLPIDDPSEIWSYGAASSQILSVVY